MSQYVAEHYKDVVNNKIKKPKKHIFALIVLSVFALMLIISCFIWKELWNYLVSFQRTDQTETIDSALQQIKSYTVEDFLDIIDTKYDEFNTKEQYIKYFREKYAENLTACDLVKKKSGKDFTAFSICLGNTEIAELKLSLDGNIDKYNHQGWKYAIEKSTELFYNEYSAEITVPAGSMVFADNILLSNSYCSDKTFSAKEFDVLNDENLRPVFTVYDTGKIFLNKPVIKVIDKSNNELTLKQEDNKYMAYYTIDNNTLDEIKKFCEDYSITYAKFMTKDLNFDSLQKYLFKDSEYYKRVRTYWIEYYRQHEITYDNVTFSEPIVYDPSHIVIDISFDYYVVLSYKTNEYHCDYTLCLLKTEDGWKIASMQL